MDKFPNNIVIGGKNIIKDPYVYTLDDAIKAQSYYSPKTTKVQDDVWNELEQIGY